MNNFQSKKGLIIKCISIIIGMALLVFVFCWVLITLSKLDQSILIALIAIIWFLFIYLGAKLLMVIAQIYSNSYDININYDTIEKHSAKSVLVNEVEDKLIKDGFDKVELIKFDNFHNGEVSYLQRIKYNKGIYIDEFYILKDVVSLEQVIELFEEISKMSTIKDVRLKNSSILQKCFFYVLFVIKRMRRISENLLRSLITFSPFLFLFL